MEKSLSLARCEDGHDAPKLCIKPSCTQSAPICKEKECQHHSKHKRCRMYSDVQDIIQGIIQKEQLQYQTFDEYLISYYDRIIKSAEVQKQEYMKLIKEPQMRLRGDERILFKLIKEGPAKDITPEIVSKVIEGLDDQSNVEIMKLMSKLKEVGQRAMRAAEKSLLYLRKLWKGTGDINKEQKALNVMATTTQPTDFIFSSEMVHKNISVLSGGKEIELINQGKFDVFALVSPAVSEKSRIRIKIIQNGGNIHLGLTNMQWLISEPNIYLAGGYELQEEMDPDYQRGQFFIDQIDPSYPRWLFQEGEVVQMEYDPATGILRIDNMSNEYSSQHTFDDIWKQEGSPLHFCVRLSDQGDKVEIVQTAE